MIASSRATRAALTGGVVAIAAAVAVGPARSDILPPCPFHAVTGFDCPGCGTTRAIRALAGGDLGVAIGYNAMSVLVVAPLLATVSWAWLARRPIPRVVTRRAFVPLLVGSFAVFTIMRNLPTAPFDALAAGSP